MLTLVCNCGSSSIKFALVDATRGRHRLRGVAEGLHEGEPGAARLRWSVGEDDRRSQSVRELGDADLDRALAEIIGLLREQAEWWQAIGAVGHRVVHGGEQFRDACRIDATVIAGIESLCPLAPLHNPRNLAGIRAFGRALPQVPQVAVFDTAFHRTLPPYAYHYALPRRLHRDLGVRRYGFHGSSHGYVAGEAIRRLGLDPSDSAVVTAHLGNGCSVCAVKDGRSVDTSMGMSPLEGLVMGTRSGDVDPALHELLARRLGLDAEATGVLLNRQSGLLGLSGHSSDMRELMQRAKEGDDDACLAVEIFCYRLAKYIAALVVPLGRLDAIVFTGGIGEGAGEIRARVIALLGHLGLQLDPERNARHGDASGRITRAGLPCALVVGCDEELLIARETAALVAG